MIEQRQLTRERPNDYVKRNGEEGTGNSCANTVAGVETKTVGFRPTCKCNAGVPVPSTVLDPFIGSGTTLLVAARLGMRGIGIDLNTEYLDIAQRRIEEKLSTTPLFNQVPA